MEIRDPAFKGLTACCISTTSYLALSLKLKFLSTVLWCWKVIRSHRGLMSVVNLLRRFFVFIFNRLFLRGGKYSLSFILPGQTISQIEKIEDRKVTGQSASFMLWVFWIVITKHVKHVGMVWCSVDNFPVLWWTAINKMQSKARVIGG